MEDTETRFKEITDDFPERDFGTVCKQRSAKQYRRVAPDVEAFRD
jgi:hypothetical protein